MRLLPLCLAAFVAVTAPALAQEGEEGERQAVPRGSRPQGDNPRVGTAVPRSPAPAPQAAPAPPPRAAAPADRSRNTGRAESGRQTVIVRPPIVVQPPAVYNYYYPRRAYPYGYGAFGLGYFYYDPYRWYPGGYAAAPGYYRGFRSVFDIGELRLQVSPRHAQVFVDGYYAGTVDDYDGAFQALKLEAGPYSIRLSAPGYEDLHVDVRISPGQKINYRGELRRLRP